MRSSRHDGRKIVRGAALPAWVAFAPRAVADALDVREVRAFEVWGTCSRCSAEQLVTSTGQSQTEAELALGRFADFHRKCCERPGDGSRARRESAQVTTELYVGEAGARGRRR